MDGIFNLLVADDKVGFQDGLGVLGESEAENPKFFCAMAEFCEVRAPDEGFDSFHMPALSMSRSSSIGDAIIEPIRALDNLDSPAPKPSL
jgi:hypothetical protein